MIFISTLKLIFILKKYKILLWLFGHAEERLARKIRLISKFIMSQIGEKQLQYTYCPLSLEVNAIRH